jgi:hypothetical protein
MKGMIVFVAEAVMLYRSHMKTSHVFLASGKARAEFEREHCTS